MNKFSAVFLLWLISPLVSAQSESESGNKGTAFKVITIDINAKAITSYLPFDESFVLKTVANNEVNAATCEIILVKKDTYTTIKTVEITPSMADKKTLEFVIPPLRPNRDYKFKITTKKVLSDAQKLEAVFKSVNRKLFEEAGNTIFPADIASIRAYFEDVLKANGGKTDVQFGFFKDDATFVSTITSLTAETDDIINQSDNSFRSISAYDMLDFINDDSFKKDLLTKALTDKQNEIANRIGLITSLSIQEKQSLLAGLITLDDLGSPDHTFLRDYRLIPSKELVLQSNDYFRSIAVNLRTTAIRLNEIRNFAMGTGTATSQIRLRELIVDLRANAGLFDSLQGIVNAYKVKLDAALPKVISVEKKVSIDFLASSSEGHKTRGGWYVGPDLGFVNMLKIDEIQPYYGFNAYFKPVNRSRFAKYSFRQFKDQGYSPLGQLGSMLATHASLSVGVTGTVASADRGTKDLWGDSNLMIGGGLRFFKYLKLSYGVVFFRGPVNSNPLDASVEVQASDYISLSFDADLAELFGVWKTKIFK